MEANETYFGIGYQGEAPFLSLSRDEHNLPQRAWMFYWARLFVSFGAKNAPEDSHTHLKYCDVGKFVTIFFLIFTFLEYCDNFVCV